MAESLFGVTTLDGKDYTFRLEKGILYINFGNNYHEYMFQNTRELPWDYIDGVIDRTAKVVRFLISKTGYGSSMKSSFFSSFSISVLVKSYLLFKETLLVGNKTRVILSNNKFSKWLSLYQRFNLKPYNKDEDSWKVDSSVDLRTTKMVGNFSYKDKSVEVNPSVACKSSIDYANFTSELCFTIIGIIDINFLTDFIVDLKTLISFAFYRQNVEFGDIRICVEYGDNNYHDVGSFYIPGLFEKEMEKPEINSFIDYGFIPWNIFYNKIGKIVEAIEQNELYVYNLPENKKYQKYISIVSIPKDASAFEFEFYRLYPDYVSVKKNNDAYKKYEEEIIKIRDTSEKEVAKICNDQLANLFNPSLKERIEYAFDQFEYLLKDIYEKVFDTCDKKQIAKVIRDARNDVDHGSLKTKIDVNVANAYYCIRILILAMTLKRFGFSDEEIKKSIIMVFEIRI